MLECIYKLLYSEKTFKHEFGPFEAAHISTGRPRYNTGIGPSRRVGAITLTPIARHCRRTKAFYCGEYTISILDLMDMKPTCQTGKHSLLNFRTLLIDFKIFMSDL